MLCKDAGEKKAVAASDVAEGSDAGEVIGFENGWHHHSAECGHGVVELSIGFGVCREILEGWHTEDFFNARFSGLDRVHEASEGPESKFTGAEEKIVAESQGM